MDIYTQYKILVKFNSELSKLAEINKGVHQGCPLSPVLFNIHLDEIITKWQKEDIKGIPLSKNRRLLTLLFANNQVILFIIEDNLQKATFKLNQIITERGLTLFVPKTISFKGRDPYRIRS